MKKVLIHYFSGTGNSLLAAKQLSLELEKYGYDPVFHAVEKGQYKGKEEFAIHLFFFPIYATSVPHIVLKYMWELPDGQKIKAGIISTNGRISTRFRDGHQGWALHQARLLLWWKNYTAFFSETLDFPHNITNAFPPRQEKYNREIITQAVQKFPAMAQRIASGEKSHRGFLPLHALWSIPFGVLYTLLGRRVIGKLFVADVSCTSCGKCVQECPVQAIREEQGQLSWRWNCEGCLRCINICPTHAIQMSTMRFAAALWASTANPLFLAHHAIPVGFVGSLGRFSGFFMDVLDLMLAIALFLLLDLGINFLSHVPLFRKIVGWGHTRLFGRYQAKRFENGL